MDTKVLRSACRLAVAVAVEGEAADPRIPAPAELRPVLGFSRMSAAAYGVVQRVVDEDGIFRARVAEQADEDAIGRAGWLWLHRPVGWLDDPELAAGPGSADGVGRRDEKAAVARLRKAAADADAARRRAADQLAAVRRDAAQVEAERDRLAASVQALQEERNSAVRSAKDVEARLAEARRDLRVARAATREAEHELRDLQRGTGAVAAPPPAPAPALPPPELAAPVQPEGLDRAAVGASVAAAARAAAELADALADTASALVGGAPDPEGAARPVADAKTPATPAKGHGKGHGKHEAKGAARRHPDLPPGVFDGTPEAHRHLVGDRANLLVVDGYNVSRAAWSGLAPEEERRRTVALLDDLQARSKGKVVVVFDGDDAVTAPKASKHVRVRFSATGQTADDAIADLLGATPSDQPVVVVSSDRAVAADARRHGALAIGARAFLAATGR